MTFEMILLGPVNQFVESMKEIEALSNYYSSFKSIIEKEKISIENEYKMGLKLSEILNTILEKENHEKYDAVEESKKYEIEGIVASDIVEISFLEKDNESYLKFQLKDKYRFNDKYNPYIAIEKIANVESQKEILIRSVLSNIIIIFEMFLTSVYRFTVSQNPNVYFQGATIKFADLFEGDVDEIINKKIVQEVNCRMFNSLEVMDIIKEKSKIDIDRYISIRKEFEEIYFRRNIFVHNGGYINEIYMNNIDKIYRTEIKLGEKIICDDLYLNNAICILKKVLCTIVYELLVNQKNDYDDIIYHILAENIGFKAMTNDDYSLAEHIYGILRKHKNFDFSDKAIMEVNYINSLKQQNKSIDSLLDSFDVTAMKDRYVIAKECLLNNNERVYELLNETYPEPFGAIEVRDWPIFVDFRKTKFYEQFKKEHIDGFNEFIFEKTTPVEKIKSENVKIV